MKIRTGFVSNSSSSSFVVAFPHKPKDAADLQRMMFGTQNVHYTGIFGESSTGESRNNEVQTSFIAEAVFERIKKKATKHEVFESIRNGWFDPYLLPELCPGRYEDMEDPEWKALHDNKKDDPKYYESPERMKAISEFYKKVDKINDERATRIADIFWDNNKRKYIVVMEFSDNDGPFDSMLEHSDIFNRLDHIRTSYH
jgi:hypothetical protein